MTVFPPLSPLPSADHPSRKREPSGGEFFGRAASDFQFQHMIPDSEAVSMKTVSATARMLQSKSPYRKRHRLHSVIDGDRAASLRAEEVESNNEEAAACLLDEASSSSSGFPSEITSESATLYGRSKRPRKTDQTLEDHTEQEFRRITRSYAKRKEKVKALEDNAVNVDWSNVFPGSSNEIGANFKKKDACTNLKVSSGFTTSGISNVSAEFCDETHEARFRSSEGVHEALEISDSHYPDSTSLASVPDFDSSSHVSQKQDQRGPENVKDFSCSEQLSDNDETPGRSSSAPTLSDYGSDYLYRNSEEFSSGYSSSLVHDSSDDCSVTPQEKSAPSFLSFFQRLSSEFCPSPKESPEHEHQYANEFTLLRFDCLDDEESYEMFRRRERNQAMLHDYTEEYDSCTNFGDLLVHQRLVMINWMVEHANTEELQCETLFLGVSLMDRVLCKGFFKTQRNLQLLGVACIILATRLEENQPYNCVRRRSFYVMGSTFSRRDVIAMEWFVQELLKFQCLPLTTFNFLWFYLKAARADAEMENLAKYLAVVSLLDHERLAFWPSTVAAGVVILASLATGHDDSCNRVMETHVRTKNDDLSECIQSLQWLVKYAN